MKEFRVFAPDGMPEIVRGDDLCQVILDSLEGNPPEEGDILVLAHKIVSKAEGRMIALENVTPDKRAKEFALETGRDPRLIQLILEESSEILWRGRNQPIICRHRLGFICANAGVDTSNSQEGYAILLPRNPNETAAKIRFGLQDRLRFDVGVIICDTHGRTFRHAACGVAIGASGIRTVKSYIGLTDRRGHEMRSSEEGLGDELAAAATLVMGQGDEGRPLCVIRGCSEMLGEDLASRLIRPTETDVFYQAIRFANACGWEKK